MTTRTWNTRSVSANQLSPLARLLVNYQRTQDPPLIDLEMAKILGVAKQTYSGWIHDKNQPRADQIKRIAELLGIDAKQVTDAADRSQNWVSPAVFEAFVGEVSTRAEAENWEGATGIIKYLQEGRRMVWEENDQDPAWIRYMRDLIVVPIDLHQKALMIAHAVRARLAAANGEPIR